MVEVRERGLEEEGAWHGATVHGVSGTVIVRDGAAESADCGCIGQLGLHATAAAVGLSAAADGEAKRREPREECREECDSFEASVMFERARRARGSCATDPDAAAEAAAEAAAVTAVAGAVAGAVVAAAATAVAVAPGAVCFAEPVAAAAVAAVADALAAAEEEAAAPDVTVAYTPLAFGARPVSLSSVGREVARLSVGGRHTRA